jgi:hypothetical protein
VLEILIAEMPPAFTTPKKRSSAVSPELEPSAIDTGPIVPREAPSGPNASNVVVPLPSVQTIPAFVGKAPSVVWLKVNVMPVAPSPEKREWPPRPEPSITPSSASTESMEPSNPGGMIVPVDGVTPGTVRTPHSKSSRYMLPAFKSVRNGLSAFDR